MPPSFTVLHYLLLFAVGLAAGTVDAIAGGGGLITLPALLGLGVPAPLALGTNKLGAVFGSGAASWSFAQRGLLSLRASVVGLLFTAIGAATGVFAVRRFPPELLGQAIPWLLLAIVVYMVLRPQLGETHRHQLMPRPWFQVVFGLSLGFYDGFFGPGVGSFWTVAFIALLGLDFVGAAANTKLMNFTSNAVALLFFALAGSVLLLPGLALGAGQLLGGRLGAHLAVTRGAKFIRPIFLVMAGLTVLKLLYSRYFPA